jgi:hypothetical protein
VRTIRRRSTLCSHSMLDRSCYCAVRARRRFTGPTSSKSSRERCTTVVRRCDIDMAGHKSAMESSLPSPTAGSEDRLPRLLIAFQPPVSSSGWSSPTVLGGCASSCFQRHASPSAKYSESAAQGEDGIGDGGGRAAPRAPESSPGDPVLAGTGHSHGSLLASGSILAPRVATLSGRRLRQTRTPSWSGALTAT